jgi:TP901 family phage tail tape measure protein
LKNTARWQISSSVLHGFMGAVQSAYGYAQDLNESLNDIRIVTNYNTDQMAKFAKEANKAAKALSATTTEYTNASLIYYQQGLSDSEIKERTDVTIKMANVSKQSAETVSDQMTAVWNNFYDGSKSLEYYADVMTRLGAETASSSDEIAQGLEKFAAIADTVGLSYEYATSALATVTAETRQSADVVGTAFKTIFARMEGLNLGETLDDGTDLNKYSAALATVGVNIKDASGEMKEMDQILEELGGRW